MCLWVGVGLRVGLRVGVVGWGVWVGVWVRVCRHGPLVLQVPAHRIPFTGHTNNNNNRGLKLT